MIRREEDDVSVIDVYVHARRRRGPRTCNKSKLEDLLRYEGSLSDRRTIGEIHKAIMRGLGTCSVVNGIDKSLGTEAEVEFCWSS